MNLIYVKSFQTSHSSWRSLNNGSEVWHWFRKSSISWWNIRLKILLYILESGWDDQEILSNQLSVWYDFWTITLRYLLLRLKSLSLPYTYRYWRSLSNVDIRESAFDIIMLLSRRASSTTSFFWTRSRIEVNDSLANLSSSFVNQIKEKCYKMDSISFLDYEISGLMICLLEFQKIW